jgi:signal transduction histidine kinase
MTAAAREATGGDQREEPLMTCAAGADVHQFALENARLTSARLPIAGLVFLASLGVVWVVEHYVHPGRDATYALVYGLEALVWAVASAWCRQTTALPKRCLAIAIASAIAQIALIASYHITERGEAEILALALVYFCVGMMVLIPWGAGGQSIVTAASVVAFVAAVALEVRAVTPIELHVIGLLCIGSVTVLSAAALQRYRFGVFRQAAELRSANSDLQQANRALAAADVAKTQMLANVSHELRTPLSVMIGYSGLIRDGTFGELSPALRETIDRIYANSQTLLGLANDLLDLSRLQANKIDLHLEPVPLAPLCAEAVACLPELLRDKPVKLRSDVPARAEVFADRDRLRQVLVNLLTNAAKFTQEGQIELRARVLNENTGIVEVADTGVGIAPDEQESIFELFRRGSQCGQVGGAGIGLALSRQLTEAMGGRLTVSSTLGKGATFTVHLPRPNGGAQSEPERRAA